MSCSFHLFEIKYFLPQALAGRVASLPNPRVFSNGGFGGCVIHNTQA
jgi:hypothetical protein